jgi:xanthine dehydrogenase accessory factor
MVQPSATRAAELAERGVPFVQATVVRAACPTSARPGDSAVVLADGTIEGFIGGQCAEGSVRTAAVPLLSSGESLLLRILPEDQAEGGVLPDGEGATTVVNPCLSGGAVEVFLEPRLPPARLAVLGNTPIARSLEILGANLGFAVDRSGEVPDVAGSLAVIVSTHGRHEVEALQAALAADVGFIGLVASRTRGKAVLDQLELSAEDRARVRTPVGIDIGARTGEEIALSILADVVRAVRTEGLRPPLHLIGSSTESGAAAGEPTTPVTVVDPVCGMTVTVMPDTPTLHHDGADHWFCNPGCRDRWAEELGVA